MPGQAPDRTLSPQMTVNRNPAKVLVGKGCGSRLVKVTEQPQVNAPNSA